MNELTSLGILEHRTGLIEEWDPLPHADLILANALSRPLHSVRTFCESSVSI
ncbi:hypothetical protein [Micrococcus aloeverae]